MEQDKVLIWGVFTTLISVSLTDYIELLEKEAIKAGVHFAKISTEECNVELLEKLKKENPDVTEDHAFKVNKNASKDLFESKVAKAAKNLKPGNNMIILEKHHNSNYQLETLDERYQPECDTLLVAFIPKFEGLFKYNPSNNFGYVPYSMGVTACSVYLSTIKEHNPAFPSECIKKAFIALSFVIQSKGKESLKKLYKNGIIDKFIEVQFTPKLTEERRAGIPDKYFQILKRTLKSIKIPFGDEMPGCEELTNYIADTPELAESGLGDLSSDAEKIDSIREVLQMFNTAF